MVVLAAAAGLSACASQTFERGYLPSQMALQQISVGASRDQVLLALGTPSTTADFGGETFYYISQKAVRPVAFMNPHVVDQRVLAVHFDASQKVTSINDYGLKDGRVFNFTRNVTPTSGQEVSFLSQLLAATGRLKM
ncbi:Beta-barrel assembly machine subunit BamE [Faunimonas pinastri]|uniref:Beta-barrel assembly machine subunit BamE n=1 Tax=Faunimonas pinastri TaxID=1855383 RepID=A0A1H9CDP0_9HYPH|nr:Beta-barrel assembly machine subunit BamE [Faunimonas pinastri]